MPDLNIKITTSADTAGAEKTVAALEKVKGAAEKTAAESHKISEEVKLLGNSVQQSTPKIEEQARATGKATEGKNKWIDALKKAGREIPGFGLLMDGLKNTYVLAAAAIAILVREIWKQIDAQNAAASAAANEVAALSGLEKPLSTTRDRHREAAEQASALANALHQIVVNAASAQTKLNETNTAIEHKLELIKQEIEAEKAKALALLEVDRASGKISEEDYERRKAGITGKAAAGIAGAEVDASQQKMKALADAHLSAVADAKEAGKALPGIAGVLDKKKNVLDAFERNEAGELGGKGAKALRAEAADKARKEVAAATLEVENQQRVENELNRDVGPKRGWMYKRQHGAWRDGKWISPLELAREKLAGAEAGLAGIIASDREATQTGKDLKADVDSQQKYYDSAFNQQVQSTQRADEYLRQFQGAGRALWYQQRGGMIRSEVEGATSGAAIDRARIKDEETYRRSMNFGPLQGGGSASGQSHGGSSGVGAAADRVVGGVAESTEAIVAGFSRITSELSKQAQQIGAITQRLNKLQGQ